VLELFSTLWLNLIGQPEVLKIQDPVGISRRISEPWTVLITTSDPVAAKIVQDYVKTAQARGLAVNEQGIWLQSGMFLLASHQGQASLPAASLTKIATSLAALDTWGPSHQFETLFSATGPVEKGVLQGDLVVQGEGDPMFVSEEAIAVGNALNQLGIRQVTGDLIITGSFLMNFEEDRVKSGNLLKQALNSPEWSADIVAQYAHLRPGTPKPQVMIAGQVRSAPVLPAQLLLRHQSLPLWNVIKRMNVYSNNVMSEQLAQLMGGTQATAQKAARLASIAVDEVQLANGSGLGVENRISPHAVTAMFAAIQRYASQHNLTVADLFPISGLDQGTIIDRSIPPAAVVKTGTLNDVSALAGVLPTRDRGLVLFTIINRGTDLDGLRASQDILLRQLQQSWGTPTQRLAEITPMAQAPQELMTLGAMSRNQVAVTIPPAAP
jgi:D-alanyl-D-alanine carboxypeptidase/D-alanyl-D-alanine-endopeptidase (penicillin-binding protein 4)